jgi:signal transduction histidine kinase/ActR/RegA family two-component response regulator
MMMLNRIRTAWILVLVAVAPVVLTAGVFGQIYLSEQKHGIDRLLEDRTRTLAAALDRELATQLQLLAMLAESPRLDKSAPMTAFAEVARRMQARISNWAMVRVASTDGRILMSEPARLPTQENRIIDLETYRQVVATGQPSIGGMVIGREGRGGFAVRVPVLRGGITTYVLTAVIRPQGLADALYFNDLPRSWHAWLVDQNGNIVSSTGPANLAGRAGAGFATVHTVENSAVSGGELATGESIRAGQAALKQVGWTVHVAAPIEVYGAIRTKAWVAFGATLVLTLILALAAIVLLAKEHRAQMQRDEAISRWQRMDALGRLTGQVAHDFNNLLMVFQAGVSGIERKHEDPEKRSRFLSMMKEGITRGAELTQRLRSYSTKSKGERERIDLGEFLHAAKPLLEKTLGDRVALLIDAGSANSSVVVDTKDLQTALVNLCKNASEAMPDGGAVSLTMRPARKSGRDASRGNMDHVEIEVADTGPGFDREAARRAFEPFFTTKSGASVGLGLTQVYGFAERSGGSVLIDAAPGGGAAVVMSLPLAQASSQHVQTVRKVALPKQVLVVDDNPETLEAARVLAEEVGMTTVTAGGAEEALRILRSTGGIDGLLSDVMMPGISGIELAERARKEFPALRMVLMTGYSEKLDQGHVLPCTVIPKPFGRVELEAAFLLEEHGRDAEVVHLYPKPAQHL